MMKFHFGRNSCDPFINCNQTNLLIDSILSLNDEKDIGLQCSHTSITRPADRYILMCQSFYDNMERSFSNVETGKSHDLVFVILILTCVAIIIFLSMNTFRLTKKLKKMQMTYSRKISQMSNM